MPLGLEEGLRLGRRGFFKEERGRREGMTSSDRPEGADVWTWAPLPLASGGRLVPGEPVALPLGQA